jgi:predicted DNA-binding transcriptional regulator AlpA
MPKTRSKAFKPPASVPLPQRVIPTGPIRMMTKVEVMKAANVKSYTTIWTWIREGIFPPPRQFSGTIRWIESEVYEALANGPQRFPKGSKARVA